MDKTDTWLVRALYVLLTIGLAIGIYMTVFKYTGNEAMCLGSGACSSVTSSPYSVINGIDVPVIGAVGNIALLFILFFENRNSFFKKNGTILFFAVALAGFAFVLWLIYLEIFVLKALCPFCVSAQTVMVLTFALAVTRLIRNPNL